MLDFRLALSCCVVIATMLLLRPMPVQASCNPERSGTECVNPRCDDGWWRFVSTGDTVEQLKADIYEYDPYIVSGYYSAAYVLMTYSSGCTTSPQTPCYVQIGWVKNGTGRRMFWQYTTQPSGDLMEGHTTAQTTGSTTTYKITSGTGVFYLWANNTLEASPPLYYNSDEADAFGESSNIQNQMPGDTTTHELFNNVQIIRSNGSGTFEAFNGSKVNDDSIFFGNTIDSTEKDEIWDRGCSS